MQRVANGVSLRSSGEELKLHEEEYATNFNLGYGISGTRRLAASFV